MSKRGQSGTRQGVRGLVVFDGERGGRQAQVVVDDRAAGERAHLIAPDVRAVRVLAARRPARLTHRRAVAF